MRYRWFAHEDEKDEFGEHVSRALWHDREEGDKQEKGRFSIGKGAGTFLAAAAACSCSSFFFLWRYCFICSILWPGAWEGSGELFLPTF